MWSLVIHPKYYLKNYFFIKCKNGWKEFQFRRQKNQESDFYKNKNATKIDDIDVNKILVSKEEPYVTKKSRKYFIRHNDNDVIRPLCIRLPQMIGYVKNFEGSTTMSFKINKKHLLKIVMKYEKELKNY